MLSKSLLKLILLSILIPFLFFTNTKIYSQDENILESIKLKDIPRLSADLPDGSLAWATLDQIHPTQPQTGKREVKRKYEMFKEAMKDNGQKYSKKFLKVAKKQIAPAYLATTPKTDSRFGKEPILAYITDRTHGSNALAELYTDVYGPEALTKPIYDKKGRPLNYVLVKISGNKTKMTEKEFVDFMVNENHAFLEKWNRGKNGETVINKITFQDLPEKVRDTTDNPWRAFIGEMQDEGMLDKIPVDYSQFKIAEKLQVNDAVTWDDISEGDHDFKKAQENTLEYIKGHPTCLESLMQTIVK